MAKTVVGLFDNYSEAQSVVNDLVNAGFDRNEISVVASNAHGEHGAHTTGGTAEHAAGHAGNAVKGVAGGAVEGGVIGGLTGLAVGLALLLVPGVGPVAAIGPLSAALTGAGMGAVSGGVIGGLVGLGIPKEEAGYYAEGVRRGGTLVSVSADDARADQALAIFNRHNPVDIDERAEYYRSTGYTGYNQNAPAYTADQIKADRTAYASYRPPTTTTAATTTATTTNTAPTTNTAATTGTTRTVDAGDRVAVPIVEEQLAVGKREVERGRARIHTRVIETPVQEQVTLREEHVTVERHAVDRPVTAADATAFREGTIEVTERAEVPVVAKEARVVEEVTIGKEATERTETVRDTVRRTDVDVDEDVDTDVTRTTGTTTTGTGRV
jgi:uncharacterized protein (TIGR02271 family)